MTLSKKMKDNDFLKNIESAESLPELDELFGNATMRNICEHHNDILFRAWSLGTETGQLAEHEMSNRWIPVLERLPESDDQLVAVQTESGARMFGRTINGRFFDNIVQWFPLPEK